LPRKEARAELGLDPEKTAVLIQLGSGDNRDVASLIEKAGQSLAKFPDVQVAAMEWLLCTDQLSLWTGVRLIRGFPISRYIKAFDFTIATASYNTFNEIMSYALPAIFIPNDHASMYDQQARRRFAQ